MHPGDTAACFSSHMGLYAIEPMVMRSLVAEIKARKAMEHPVDQPTLKAEHVAVPGQMQTVAVIAFHGAVSKKRSKFSEASAIEMRSAIRQAAKDPTVSKIVLHIDSPGGAVGGIDDLAAEVREAKAHKPVVAYIEDLGASAAYWVASQATEIVANRGAFVGSLGVYGVIHDTSGAYEREGIKVHVVSSGGAKGKGVAGVPVDETTLAEERRLIEAITDLFKVNVRAGRGLTHQQTTDLFDGRVHMADKALELGLIDRIGSFESTLTADEPKTEKKFLSFDSNLVAEFPKKDEEEKPAKPGDKEDPEESEEDEEEDMPEEKKTDATVSAANVGILATSTGHSAYEAELSAMAADLKAEGCPVSAERILNKLKAAGSMAEAEKVAAALRQMQTKTGAFAPAGAQPDIAKSPAGEFSGKSKQELEAAFTAKVKEHRASGKDLQTAVMAAKDENPTLHAAYIASFQRKQ